MNIAIIPARGGSKRIPRKNIKQFHGKPILAYSIDVALSSGCFDRVIVSTDDQEIAQIASSYGAEVPYIRSPELADDFTGTNAVVADVLRRLNISSGNACCIYATAPFVTKKVIIEGLEKLQFCDCEYAVTVTSFPFPIQRATIVNINEMLELNEPKHRMTRSQDLPEMFHDAGQVYWGKVQAFLQDKPLFSGTTAPVILPRHLVQDIDTIEDWVRAEAMYEVLRSQRAFV
ncbi:pseudaminic acid cytidylyltransferase [Vibrio mimicus]|uniref:pseudaminic acid cytidylyltransferase n=1 Tax=Vibrio mimicus TaxID=674 RepID=UPI0011D7C1B1|nr:pseudaminic acid cytidylyltransferase [Vibrio mimicus]TXZ77089.1 pseudaminic acid cytidylyltransferase [Vibrio mimicus]BCN22674.1 putative monosaccharide biosynthesis protein [Vibrio mimicus]